MQEIKQAEQTPVTVHYYHCDHLGTPIALTDRQGQIVWAAQYDPWGNIIQEYNPDNMEQNIRLPGQYHDRETGLYYNYHRYYDPKIGSYINQDPIGPLGGWNLSAYTRNPLRFIDPLGLKDAPEAVLERGRIQAQKNLACRPDHKCEHVITVSVGGSCDQGDTPCSNALRVAGFPEPYVRQYKKYDWHCLLRFGIGMKSGETVAEYEILSQVPSIAEALGAGARVMSIISKLIGIFNSPGSVVGGIALGLHTAAKKCECNN
jgi:RHS repeat-associated protein